MKNIDKALQNCIDGKYLKLNSLNKKKEIILHEIKYFINVQLFLEIIEIKINIDIHELMWGNPFTSMNIKFTIDE